MSTLTVRRVDRLRPVYSESKLSKLVSTHRMCSASFVPQAIAKHALLGETAGQPGQARRSLGVHPRHRRRRRRRSSSCAIERRAR